MKGRFVLVRSFIGSAFALAAGVIVTLLLAAALQYRAEVRHEQAAVRAPPDIPSPNIPSPPRN